MDAVVIIRRLPKTHLDRHYKPVSYLSVRTKGRTPSPRNTTPDVKNDDADDSKVCDVSTISLGQQVLKELPCVAQRAFTVFKLQPPAEDK